MGRAGDPSRSPAGVGPSSCRTAAHSRCLKRHRSGPISPGEKEAHQYGSFEQWSGPPGVSVFFLGFLRRDARLLAGRSCHHHNGHRLAIWLRPARKLVVSLLSDCRLDDDVAPFNPLFPGLPLLTPRFSRPHVSAVVGDCPNTRKVSAAFSFLCSTFT